MTLLRTKNPGPENHDPPKSGIPIRKKTDLEPGPFGKIDYSITPKSESLSMRWPFFTGDDFNADFSGARYREMPLNFQSRALFVPKPSVRGISRND